MLGSPAGTLACVTEIRGRKSEAFSSVSALARNPVFYNLFRFSISNAYSD